MNIDLQKIKKGIQILIVALLCFIAILFVGAATPWVGDYQTMTVLSGSMEPEIKSGSVAVISPQDSYQAGDIITFSTGRNLPSTHRITDKETTDTGPIYKTKGDANPTGDLESVTKEDVLGGFVFSIPYLGYVVEFAKTGYGFALLILLPAIWIISGEIKNIYKEIKKSED